MGPWKAVNAMDPNIPLPEFGTWKRRQISARPFTILRRLIIRVTLFQTLEQGVYNEANIESRHLPSDEISFQADLKRT